MRYRSYRVDRHFGEKVYIVFGENEYNYASDDVWIVAVYYDKRLAKLHAKKAYLDQDRFDPIRPTSVGNRYFVKEYDVRQGLPKKEKVNG